MPLLASINSNSYPEVLSADEEIKYLKLWKERDYGARDVLIEHNLRLVAHIVKRYENTKEDKDDLLSIGSIGLIKAIDTFNFESQAKLSTYAARCIENEILMYLRANKKSKQTTWLYTTIGTDKEGNEIKLCDIIEDPSDTMIQKIINQESLKDLNNALKILTEREKEIINQRYGLDDNFPLTQREIAEKMNISRSYVSRIEKRALTKIYLELKNKR